MTLDELLLVKSRLDTQFERNSVEVVRDGVKVVIYRQEGRDLVRREGVIPTGLLQRAVAPVGICVTTAEQLRDGP